MATILVVEDNAANLALSVFLLEGAGHTFGAVHPFAGLTTDLAQAIDLPLTLDYIAVSSYGKATKSTGEVKLIKDLDQGLEGRDLLVVEDIVDTGLTLNYLVNLLRARGPRSLKVASLLSKPSRRLVSVEADYTGFTIDDHFVVGCNPCERDSRRIRGISRLSRFDFR